MVEGTVQARGGYPGAMAHPQTLRFESRANPRFKTLKAELAAPGLRRVRTMLLGAKLIEAWAEAPHQDRLRPALWLRRAEVHQHPLERRLGLETWELSEALMQDLAEAGTPPDHILVGDLSAEGHGPLGERVIVPWQVQDPGNLGAILRSAAAFGFTEALLGPGCADPFSPKALRGTMGAAFLLKLRRCTELPLDEAHWYALHGGPESLPLAEADLAAPLRILVGNEGHGWRETRLPKEVRFLAIPIQGVESLNAAVAAGIVCFEASRRLG